jgi:hypothetical protein
MGKERYMQMFGPIKITRRVCVLPQRMVIQHELVSVTACSGLMLAWTKRNRRMSARAALGMDCSTRDVCNGSSESQSSPN